MKFPRLIPDSLAARTVLLLIVVVALAQSVTFSMLFENDRELHMRQTTRMVVGQVRQLQKILPGLDAEARRRLEASEGGEQWLQLQPDSETVPGRPPHVMFAARLERRLGEMLGETVTLRQADRHGGLWIGFLAGGERWWLILPAPRFEPQGLPRDFWGWLVTVLVLIILIGGLFVRGIVRPLQRLGEAVADTGDGRARTIEPSGPGEVRRLAEQHNRMVGQLAQAESERREMLAGLTHDLRAPLARLRVRLALLENDEERNGLHRDAEDMERIVGQCLAFLRSESADAAAAPPLSIADAVSDEVARQRELGRPVDIEVSEAAAACQVSIAHGNLQRVLDNLIDNALQHGAPPVEVALCVLKPASVTLRVRDHGTGIPDALRDHAQEAFVQIEPARATGGSCGLGLAIVRRIVGSSGGSLRLETAPGGGLDVLVTFPVVRE